MSTMTKDSLAAALNGREYGNEITVEEQREAAQNGLVVLFAYSDDNAEFRGAFTDEIGCYNGGMFLVYRRGVLGAHDKACECRFCGYAAAAKQCVKIEALWCKPDREYAWRYKTDIPHACFDILENGEKFCRGIVFNVSDLPESKL